MARFHRDRPSAYGLVYALASMLALERRCVMSDAVLMAYLVIAQDEVRYRTDNLERANGFAAGWTSTTGDDCEIAVTVAEEEEGGEA